MPLQVYRCSYVFAACLYVFRCLSFPGSPFCFFLIFLLSEQYLWCLFVLTCCADFIVDNTADIAEDERRMHRRPLLPREEQEEDVEDLERRIQERYARSSQAEYDEETTEVEQQALLPSVRDPKLWMVKCAVGLS